MKIKKTERTGRSEQDSEWIYGLNPVLEAIKSGRGIRSLYLSSGRHDSPGIVHIKKEAERKHLTVTIADIHFFHSRFPKGHQGIAAQAAPRDYMDLEEMLLIPERKGEMPLFIILDCIEDPRNFGAVIRVADAAGAHGIIIQSHRSVTLTPEVLKTSAGAAEYMPVAQVVNIKHAIQRMKEQGITVAGAEAAMGTSLWDVDLNIPLALVIGSEGEGLRKTVKEYCDFLISLPMQGKINSLNASVATGIMTYEIFRQRTSKSIK